MKRDIKVQYNYLLKYVALCISKSFSFPVKCPSRKILSKYSGVWSHVCKSILNT